MGTDSKAGEYVHGTQIEIINPGIERGRFRHVIFDFDGTISLIRQGWQQVMIPLMISRLAETPRAESRDAIENVVTEMVTRTTGKQTIYQMIELCDMIRARGGTPKAPLVYKRIYLDRLLAKIQDKREGLRDGTIRPEEMLVAGSVAFLQVLRERDVTLYCASGTDEPYMHEEARLVGASDFFSGGLFGARDDYKSFSKRMLIDKIIRDHGLHGSELMTFGDGFVEIEETKRAGGVAIGVATDEVRRAGVDAWKRNRLIEAGADVIIPDFRETEALVGYLFDEERGPHADS